MVDFVIAASLDLPRALYDSVAMTAFNLFAGVIAWWLHRQLGRGSPAVAVISAFSALLFVFAVANVAIGVALAPRYAEPSPDAIYGNNLAQQITSTFDVVICMLCLVVMVVMLFTGPLAGYLMRRREPRVPEPEPSTVAQPSAPPRIVRRPEDSSTTVSAPETEQFTTALRIQRREPPS